MDPILVIYSAGMLLSVAVPILVYCLRVKPVVERENILEIVLGVLTTVFVFVPVSVVLPLNLDGFILCLIGSVVLLIVHWVLWLAAAVRKKPASKLIRLCPALVLLLWTNCTTGAIAWVFIIIYGILVLVTQKEK